MLSQFVGLLLLGLGVKTPYTPPAVKGDSTEATQTINTRQVPVLKKSELVRDGGTATRPGDVKDTMYRERAKEAHENLVKSRQDFLEQLKTRREATKEEFKARQEAFKEKLAAIKDARKKALVEKLNARCQEINKNRTDRMTEMLTKLSSILENVTNRAATAKTNGKDTTSIDTAVASAQTAITTAQTAVAAQAGRECVITINSEKTLKTDVGTAISGLEKDIKAVYYTVVTAQKAVRDAVKALGLVLGESLTEKLKPTVTPTTTP